VTRVNPVPRSRLLCAALLLACAPPAAVPPPAAEYAAMEREVARRVNAHRAVRRLTALTYDTALAAIARAHSLEMAAQDVPMGHDGFHERADRVDRFMPLQAIAENVAMNDYGPARTVAVAVAGWLASPHHLENIEGHYDVTGVGIVRARDGTFYYTQLFVARRKVSEGRP
jgi:uncharacterized protein YkwD